MGKNRIRSFIKKRLSLRNHAGSQGGFTLIASLFLIVLLLLLIAAFGVFLFMTLHSVSSERYSGYAKQSALFGLQVALGELQGAAGPDQRVTANSSIFDNTTLDYPNSTQSIPATGQGAWVGVWSSDSKPIPPDVRPQANPNYPQYDPSTPSSRAGDFVGWLVSATSAGHFSLPTSPAAVAAPVSSLPASGNVQNYIALTPPTGTGTPSNPYVQVQKVLIDQIPGGNRYCAFSVEDEGAKADLSWNQTPDSVVGGMAAGQAQDIRLSSAPGPDFGQLNGTGNNGAPFPATTYPLTTGNDAFLTNALPLLRDPADAQTVFSATPPSPDWPTWLAASRPDMTGGSRGVLADVQRGGLRRDLSLAFEMDGNSQFGYTSNAGYANYNNAALTGPPLFNLAAGEFAGGGATDPLSPPASDPGSGVSGYIPYSGGTMPFLQRFVYRHLAASGDLQRGPDWHLLRDYYNLYKRLGGSPLSLSARATYPNVSDWPRVIHSQSMFDSLTGLVTDSKPTPMGGEFGIAYQDVSTLSSYPAATSHYIWKPLQGQYAPVYLGTTWLYSVAFVPLKTPVAGTYDMVLCVDKVFYIWNPYNRTLNVPAFRVYDASYAPGWLNYTTQDKSGIQYWGSGTSGSPPPPPVYDYASVNIAGQGDYYLFYPSKTALTPPFTMQPGEVKAFSPNLSSSSGLTAVSTGDTTALEGYSFTGTQGQFYRYFPAPAGSTTYATSFSSSTTPDIQVDLATLSSVSLTLSLQTANSIQSQTLTSLPSPLETISVTTTGTHEDDLQQFMILQNNSNGNDGENSPVYVGKSGTVAITSATSGGFQPNTKYFFAQMSALRKTTLPSGSAPMEVFSRLNPMALNSFTGDPRVVPFNSTFSASVLSGSVPPNSTAAIQSLLGSAPTSIASPGTAYWGNSFGSNGTSFIPMLNIPSSPLYSLEALNGATIDSWAQEPFQPLGNSYPSPYLGPVASSPGANPPLQGIESGFTSGQPEYNLHILTDVSWYLNDGLFDRYYFSGLVPPFSMSGSYAPTGTLAGTLNSFFSANYPGAGANPVLHPYLPPGGAATQAVSDLLTVPDSSGTTVAGFNKVGAYSLIDGAFNVNSTSVPAWTAFLMANKNLPVSYNSNFATDSGIGTPFPSSTQPGGPAGNAWTGFSRLTDTQIATLAANIVQQVHLRGPFMSLSDFINHRIVLDATGTCGALQAAINASSLNGTVAAQGTTPNYSGAGAASFFSAQANSTSTSTTASGLPGYISQANLLLPLAPRLSARSDTFRIRAYGEVRLTSGSPRIVAQAACEAVVQRVPEYVDSSNKPWDEGVPGSTNPNAGLKSLTTTNQYLGRRFKIIQFRWLNPNEL